MNPFTHRHLSWLGTSMLIAMTVLGVTSNSARAADSSSTAPLLRTVSMLDASLRPAGVPTDYVVTPNGYFAASCVQRVQANERVHTDGSIERADGTIRKPAACTMPHYSSDGTRVEANGTVTALTSKARKAPTINGWVMDSDYSSSVAIGRIVASWVVPSAPSKQSSQTDYYFPGMEQSEASAKSILQPVLGWNAFSNFPQWSMASWNCCVSGTTYYSNPISVSAGDQITGDTKSTCGAWPSCATWAIISTDETTGGSTTLDTDPYAALSWVFGGVNEVYSVSSCAQLPASGSITYSSIQVYDINNNRIASPPWVNEYDVGSQKPQCSYNIASSASTVTLSWKP